MFSRHFISNGAQCPCARHSANDTLSYDEEPAKSAPAPPVAKSEPEPVKTESIPEPIATQNEAANIAPPVQGEQSYDAGDAHMDGSAWNGAGEQSHDNAGDDDNYGPINVKEDG